MTEGQAGTSDCERGFGWGEPPAGVPPSVQQPELWD